jgi:hypothetical protein
VALEETANALEERADGTDSASAVDATTDKLVKSGDSALVE